MKKAAAIGLTALVLGLTSPGEVKGYIPGPLDVIIPLCSEDQGSFEAEELGISHLTYNRLKSAAKCFEVVANNRIYSDLHSDSYGRVAELLNELNDEGFSLNEVSSFAQAADNALADGNEELASKLYEVAALGDYLNFSNSTFAGSEDYHRLGYDDRYLQAGTLMSLAADLTDTKEDQTCILLHGIKIMDHYLTVGSCGNDDCKEAIAMVNRMTDQIAEIEGN